MIVVPVFSLIFIGTALRKTGLLSLDFSTCASRIVYRVALPVLIFLKIAQTDFFSFFNWQEMVFVYAATSILYVLLWILSRCVSIPEDRGVLIQGSFRGNFAVIGFPLIANAYGEPALARAAIVLAYILPLYNGLSILALSLPAIHAFGPPMKKIAVSILLNPLILAVFAALPFSLCSVPLPEIITRTLNPLSAMVLPLALLALGGSLDFNIKRDEIRMTAVAVLLKNLIFPVLLTGSAVFLGFRNESLGVLTMLFFAPTALVSYVMTESMGGNTRLASHIIMITTIFSVITITASIYILTFLGYI